MKNSKFYNLNNLMKIKADTYVIYGDSCIGKTFVVLDYIIQQIWRSRKLGIIKQGAILTRWGEDLKSKRAEIMFQALIMTNRIKDITEGVWNTVVYKCGRWYFAKDSDNFIIDSIPIFIGFALTESEYDKSIYSPHIDYVLFDNFTSRQYYLKNEFIIFKNVLNNIKQECGAVTTFMLGNPTSKTCPYFFEMGLNHITKMKIDDIDVYEYNDSVIAVEYCCIRY